MRDRFRNKVLPRIRLFAALTVAILAAPASDEERTVNCYSWSSYMAPEVLENFTRETGMKVV